MQKYTYTLCKKRGNWFTLSKERWDVEMRMRRESIEGERGKCRKIRKKGEGRGKEREDKGEKKGGGKKDSAQSTIAGLEKIDGVLEKAKTL